MDYYLDFIAPCLISKIARILEQNADSYLQVKEACYLFCSVGDNVICSDPAFICAAQNCLSALSCFQHADEYQRISSSCLARKLESYLTLSAA